MALLAESLIEEWLNRSGYFTIRGVRTGVDEIDLLGFNPKENKAIHIESQISFRPVGYISPLAKDLAKQLGKAKTTALERTSEMMQASVSEWVQKKFYSKKKIAAREHYLSNHNWSLALVHGVVRDENELRLIENNGIRVIPFYKILHVICRGSDNVRFKAHSGTDIAEMIEFYSFRTLYDPDINIFI